jgi:hypothetical protein
MPSDTVEVQVQLARLEVQVANILSSLEKSETSRGKQYEAIESLRLAFDGVASRIKNVEDKLAGQAPTIQEFITMKNKVLGAGQFGKWLWVAGGILIGVVAKSREAILHWFAGGAPSAH